MEIYQFPSHYSSWNLSFSTSIIDSSLLLISTLVLSPSNIICDPSAANASANRFSFLGACSISKVKNFSPFSGPLLCTGLGWVLLRRSFPWSNKPLSSNHPALSNAWLLSQGPWLARLGRLHILPCCLNRGVLAWTIMLLLYFIHGIKLLLLLRTG